MRDASSHECVKVGEMLVVPCPNGCGPSLVMEWLISDSSTLVGHWLTCPGCRPDGAWSCTECAQLIAPDGIAIWDHVVAGHG